MKVLKTEKLLKEWKLFLNDKSNILFEANINIKLSQAIDVLSNTEAYTKDLVGLKSGILKLKEKGTWGKLKKYYNVLIDQFNINLDSTDSEKYNLFEKLEVIEIHEEKIFKNMTKEEQSHIIKGEYSVFELEEEIEELSEKRGVKKSLNKRFSFDTSHSKIIYKDENIIVVKPLTTLGSMVWGRGMYDGTREKDNKSIKGLEIEWCTTIASKENQFSDYFLKENINLYYFIKNTNIFRGDDSNRKWCISYATYRDNIKLSRMQGTIVDSNNDIPHELDYDNLTETVLASFISGDNKELYDSYMSGLSSCKQDSDKDKRLLNEKNKFNWSFENYEKEMSNTVAEYESIDLPALKKSLNVTIAYLEKNKDLDILDNFLVSLKAASDSSNIVDLYILKCLSFKKLYNLNFKKEIINALLSVSFNVVNEYEYNDQIKSFESHRYNMFIKVISFLTDMCKKTAGDSGIIESLIEIKQEMIENKK